MELLKQLEVFLEDIKKMEYLNEEKYWENFVIYLSKKLNAQASTFFLVDEEKKHLNFWIVYGQNSEELKGVSFPYSGIAGWCAQNLKGILVKDILENPLFTTKIDKVTNFKTKSVIAVPAFYLNKLIGILEIINPLNKESFSEEDYQIVKLLNIYFSNLVYLNKLVKKNI